MVKGLLYKYRQGGQSHLNNTDIAISEFAELLELTCDYVIDEFIIDDKFIPVFPEVSLTTDNN